MNKVIGQTVYRQELRERILKAAMNEFFEKGVKAVTMDDIAQKLSISKRTLYEIYDNKEELLLEGMKDADRELDLYMHSYSEKPDKNVMDILIEYYHLQLNRLSRISPLYFEDLPRYERIREYIEKKHRERDEATTLFFRRGMEEGFFRQDVNYTIVARLGREMLHYAMKNKLYKEFGMHDLFRNLILLFIRGICTIKGIERLELIQE